MHHMETVFFLILLVSETLKMLRAKAEAHFLKKLAFVTNKCLAQDAFGECARTLESLSKYTAVRKELRSQVSLFCRIFYKGYRLVSFRSVTETHCPI